SLPPAVWSVAGILAIYDVRCDRQDRLCMNSFAIRGILPQLLHKSADDPRSELIDPIVIVAKLRKLALGLVVRHKPALIADYSNFGISDCGEAVGNHRHSSHPESHRSQRPVIMQRHFEPFIR